MANLNADEQAEVLPGEGLDPERMPGHWLLAQMGQRTLRPGGRELTEQMLATLGIQSTDDVVEFAPGLGAIARTVLRRNPDSYTGIEREEAAARQVRRFAIAKDSSASCPGRSPPASRTSRPRQCMARPC